MWLKDGANYWLVCHIVLLYLLTRSEPRLQMSSELTLLKYISPQIKILLCVSHEPVLRQESGEQ